MNNKDPRMPGMSWISPYLTVEDVAASSAFYQKVFGFTEQKMIPDENGKPMHASLIYRDLVVMVGAQSSREDNVKSPASTALASPMSLYVYVENVDDFCTQAATAGAEIVQQPEDTFWGDRMCNIKDKDGYIWAFATTLAE